LKSSPGAVNKAGQVALDLQIDQGAETLMLLTPRAP